MNGSAGRRSETIRVRLGCLLLIAASPLALAGRPFPPDGIDLEIRMGTPEHYMHETCWDFPPGRELAYAFESPHPVDFNIHYHTVAATEMPVSIDGGTMHSGRLSLGGGGERCFMWTNPVQRPEGFSIFLRLHVDPEKSAALLAPASRIPFNDKNLG